MKIGDIVKINKTKMSLSWQDTVNVYPSPIEYFLPAEIVAQTAFGKCPLFTIKLQSGEEKHGIFGSWLEKTEGVNHPNTNLFK